MQRRNTLLPPDQWTPDYVNTYLRGLCEAQPRRRNPVDDEGVCRYTGMDGRHCLIGQMLADHGMEMPVEGESAAAIIDQGVDGGAVWQLTRWQAAADDPVTPVSWGILPAVLVDQDGHIDRQPFPPSMRRRGPQIAAFIGILLVLTVAALTLASLAGAQQLEQTCTRPYADLTADQLPNLCTVQFDGQGHAHLAGNNPDSGLTWHVATFHVPDPDQWDQQTVVVETTLPVGPFNVTLACEAGAAQVDVWLDGHEDAYVADTTLDCAAPCFLDIAVPVPDAVPSVERHDDAPCGHGTSAAGAPSGQPGSGAGMAPVLVAATNTTPTTPPPVGVASSAAETTPTLPPSPVVSAAAATNTLAVTGPAASLLWRLGLLLAVVGGLIVICTWNTGRKVNGR